MMNAKQFLLCWVLFIPQMLFSGMPQPMVVYYGQARDQYGWPYRSGATVILRVGTNEITRQTINGSISPGVNFALYLPIDDGRNNELYVPYASSTGGVVSVVVVDSRGERAIIESALLPRPGNPGDIHPINITAGIDSDGDGLPDEWEWELLLSGLNPLYNTLAEITPSGDYDGDGQSNEDEYHAGTFAFLDYDFFYEEVFERTPNGRMSIAFLSVPGMVYRIESAPSLLSGNSYAWQSSEYARSDTEAFQQGVFEGTGDWLTLYVPVPDQSQVWRLQVQ